MADLSVRNKMFKELLTLFSIVSLAMQAIADLGQGTDDLETNERIYYFGNCKDTFYNQSLFYYTADALSVEISIQRQSLSISAYFCL